MTTDDSTATQQEAVELPPRQPGEPAPDVLVYATGQKAVLDVYRSGRWHQGIVRERLRFPHGGTAYKVLLDLGTGRHEVRTYIWPTGLRVKFVPKAAPSL
ncbi:hypothetical protein ACEZCY_35735 [Streptacidiphilus sp. N1-12]|uniref:Uncharacterized protein n=1 Tax=Streptacidiphilus alkalitolerans TaxID=3342712 RepID=A0ABV6WRX0_9ACTN